ncbi:valine--tRNA ligase [Mycoplasma sp. Ms02]|uniref:valine--tRNA ligase n=1 Tax=Mycoplasma sp. Ms02 TaxID=353851 RepID=UPI001C8A7075|nr:valine--tRNA ligase [Mycoplasma sp. Ms02]QZE12588.1 valine--tRNA ligase [Mycoplasma sp. Ms02]
MEKIYNHKEAEKGIEQKWRDKKFFSNHDQRKKPFSILLPPPNVTGKLHLGHALNSYIQDTIIRFKKLQGYDVFWIAGMDHAGIATQAKVEQVLMETEGVSKYDLGREGFLDKVWEWKYKYADIFRSQWQALGLALDYENERFTLDEEANKAVLQVFVDLYNKGLIYRGVKAINWDVQLQTSLSNIEVINKPVDQKMYYIRYQVENSDQNLIVATVRTETLLSDVAVVVNPEDERYKDLVGKNVIHPLTGKVLPIITDEYVELDFGTGAMKLSAHAEADIEIIKKHNFEIIETIDKNGFINSVDSEFHGLERFEARQKIADKLAELNKLEKVETSTSQVGYSERSKTPIEILVMPQWFVSMEKFGQDILKHLASEDGVEFYPKRMEQTLVQWMENVHDWNISRQLWWGHRIPAWFKDGEIKVQIESPGTGWTQDEDVLDTWFSSGISTFAFLGWPNSLEMVKRYYPSDVLVTGYDLIFFWIARMYMFGLEFMNQKPFKHVLLHGLVRDENNQKMSKSLNNGIDPIDVLDQYGSDATRWFLVTNTTAGQDLRFSHEKLKNAWALNNKIWNISRYIYMLEDNQSKEEWTDIDKWISNKLHKLQAKIENSMEKYEFTVIGTEIYNFIYEDFSSWYIELLKVAPSKENALKILKQFLITVHPFLPFITDRIYTDIFKSELLDNELSKAEWFDDVEYVDDIIESVKSIRDFRETNNISKKEVVYYYLKGQSVDKRIEAYVNKLAFAEVKVNQDALFALKNYELYIEINEELKQENRKRLESQIDKLHFEIARIEKMLSNEGFVNKAPEKLINAEKNKLTQFKEELKAYEEELKWKYLAEKN